MRAGVHGGMSTPSGTARPDFDIRVLTSASRSVVFLRGDLDAYSAARLHESLAELVGAGARHIVIDLRDLSFMAASGLGVLVGAAKRVQRLDGKLVLRSAQPSVRRIIEITGLDGVLPQT